MVLDLALTFGCGAAYELACVFWVQASESNRAGRAAAWSCFAALVTCLGLGEALHQPAMIAAYASGFGFGTYVGVRIKARKINRQKA
jgi:uncharacterized protein YebE (UPF0316 family)